MGEGKGKGKNMIKRGPNTRFETVEIAGEDEYTLKTVSLGTAHTNEALGIEGQSLTIFRLDGTASIRFDGTAHDDIPLLPIEWPAMVIFERQFNNVYLSNTIQSGKAIRLYAGQTT